MSISNKVDIFNSALMISDETVQSDLMSVRRSELTARLILSGLNFDPTNEVCLQYVYLGEGALYNNLDEIVTIMAQNRFLNEYCNHEAGVRLARDQCSSVRLPRDQWLQRVRRCVLHCSGYSRFPEVWPWNQNVDSIVTKTQTKPQQTRTCQTDDGRARSIMASAGRNRRRDRSLVSCSALGARWPSSSYFHRNFSPGRLDRSWRRNEFSSPQERLD